MAGERRQPFGVGFLLSALGAHSAAAFSEAVAPLGIDPPRVGLLRAIGHGPGRSQQALADQFHMVPSRMVVLLDDLERDGLVERRRDAADRRVHLLHLTPAAESLLREVEAIGRRTDTALLDGLSAGEQRALRDLLDRLADLCGLAPGVHPGYRWLRPARGARSASTAAD